MLALRWAIVAHWKTCFCSGGDIFLFIKNLKGPSKKKKKEKRKKKKKKKQQQRIKNSPLLQKYSFMQFNLRIMT